MNNYFDSIDKNKLNDAINAVKEIIGKEEAERLEKAFAQNNGNQFISGLSSDKLAAVKSIIENPALLRKILSTPQGREAITKITKG